MANLRDWLPNLLALTAMCLGFSKSSAQKIKRQFLQGYMSISHGYPPGPSTEGKGRNTRLPLFPWKVFDYILSQGLGSNQPVSDLLGCSGSLKWLLDTSDASIRCPDFTLFYKIIVIKVILTVKYTRRPVEQD